MNDNNLNQNGSGTYKATTNLNTAIDNPQINVNSATGVNVQDLGYNNYVESTDQNNNTANGFDYSNVDNTNSFDINSNSDVNLNSNVSSDNGASVDSNVVETNTVNSNTVDTSSYNTVVDDNSGKTTYTYAPTLEEKKIKQQGFVSVLFHSKEFRTLIFIVFILCLFLMVMPKLYDLMRSLQLLR